MLRSELVHQVLKGQRSSRGDGAKREMTWDQLRDPSGDTATMHHNAQRQPETKNTLVSVSANIMRRDDPHPERLGRKGSGSHFVTGET